MTRLLLALALPTILLGGPASVGAQGAGAQRAAPVTEAALLEADPAEWLTYGRDYAETHYSPLDQINSDNVDRLGLAWFWTNGGGAGRVEATPLGRPFIRNVAMVFDTRLQTAEAGEQVFSRTV